MQLGMIGLGRMGANMARRLMNRGHDCVVFDTNAAAVAEAAATGATGARSIEDFINRLKPPRAIWIMLPVPVVEGVVKTVAAHLGKGDILIDGGNSPFENAIRRAAELKPQGIDFVDVGTSGGVWGLERGYCLMIGGSVAAFQRLEPIFVDLAGHFVKMVHNGIEYGMMAAYAEGFNLLRHAGAGLREGSGAPDSPERYQYDLDLGAIAEVWRRGSVVTSWLLDLTAASLAKDAQLGAFHGRVSDSGEGRWTLKAAIDTAVPVPVLSAALYSRFESRGEAEFANRLLSAMRFQFGGHVEPGQGQAGKPQPGKAK
ncbi:MAG: decarboxylating 6-phosphogluconate dehydrogenase [Gammaproteobacteria bacterium PRO9]|nr:decarboxylating 6-phosphogluconate dehydrogenase [Gammaproteobacteria bacterium PRO9]